MGDDEDRTALHQAVHASLDDCFGSGIDARRRLIQDQDGRVGNGCTGDGQKLTLSLGQVAAISGEHGIIALGQVLDKAVCACQHGCALDLAVGGVQLAVPDIVGYGAGKQVAVLKYHT